jgi:hypothetical protein
MNVPQTQSSLFRQLDAVSIVANIQQAAEQAQRQAVLSEQREALHRQGSVGQAENSHQSSGIGGRQQEEDGGQNGSGAFRQQDQGGDAAAPLKDSPNPGPLGHHFDIIA